MATSQSQTPQSRLVEAQKQTRIAFDDLGTDHPQAARVLFVVDELDELTDSI